MDIDLDRYGIIVCNVNSTNFKPYKRFADARAPRRRVQVA